MAEIIGRAIKEEPEQPVTNTYFYIILGAVVLIFIGFIAYQYILISRPPLTIEDLHNLNIKCNLPSERSFLISISCWWKNLPPERGYVHNSYSFVLSDGIWYTEHAARGNIYKIGLHYGPRDVAEIPFNGTLNSSFNEGFDVYITVNPLSDGQNFIALAASELAQNVVTAIQRRPVGACDRNESAMCEFRPIVNCTTTDHAMIYLLHEPGPSVELNNQCIILRGENYDLVKAADRLLLEWYGIQ